MIKCWLFLSFKILLKHGRIDREKHYKKFFSREKYTNGGSSKEEAASPYRYQGWLSEGIEGFNKLYDVVKANRSAPSAKLYEELFYVFCKSSSILRKG